MHSIFTMRLAEVICCLSASCAIEKSAKIKSVIVAHFTTELFVCKTNYKFVLHVSIVY